MRDLPIYWNVEEVADSDDRVVTIARDDDEVALSCELAVASADSQFSASRHHKLNIEVSLKYVQKKFPSKKLSN